MVVSIVWRWDFFQSRVCGCSPAVPVFEHTFIGCISAVMVSLDAEG